LWIDNFTNGFIYPIYTGGWVQQIAKNDVNISNYSSASFWIRGQTGFWNYIADVPKNIWLSNETPYYVFKQWNQLGQLVNASENNAMVGSFFRYSTLNTFNSYTAYEYANSLFIDPVIQTALTQRNEILMYNNSYQTTCPSTRYTPALFGWHYQDRSCHYAEIPVNFSGWNIGTTINGTFITAITYALIKTKFWENYPITRYNGTENWAWVAWYNTSNNQTLGFTTKFGADQEDVYSDNYGRAVLFSNYGAGATTPTILYRPQFRADLNRETDRSCQKALLMV